MTAFRLNPVTACLRGGLATAFVLTMAPALAKPPMPNPTIIHGEVNIQRPGYKITEFHQSTDRLILEWLDFSIGKKQTFEFIQPGSDSVALNRVTGGDPSQILGSLIANGRVFLVNPAGIVFGQGAQVDVGALVATTLDISNEDFLTGQYHFSGEGAGSIRNAGSIQVGDNGFVVLAAPTVENAESATIRAGLGRVVLAAGDTLTLDLDDGGLIGYSIGSSGDTDVSQRGQIFTDGGHVYLDAAVAGGVASSVVNQNGLIRATGLARGVDGGIYITGGDVTQIGTLQANGVDGGEIAVIADGHLQVGYGEIDATYVDYYPSLSVVSRDPVTPAGGHVALIGRGSLQLQGYVHTGAGGSLYVESGDALELGWGEDTGEASGSQVPIWLLESTLASGSDVTVASGTDIRLTTAFYTLYGDEQGRDTGSDMTVASGRLRLAIGGCESHCIGGAGFVRGDHGSIVSDIESPPRLLADYPFEPSADIASFGHVELLAGRESGEVRLGSIEAGSLRIETGGDVSIGSIIAGSERVVTADARVEILADGDVDIDSLRLVAGSVDGTDATAFAQLVGRDLRIGELTAHAYAGEAGGNADVDLRASAHSLWIDSLQAEAHGEASEGIFATVMFEADTQLHLGDASTLTTGSASGLMSSAIELHAGAGSEAAAISSERLSAQAISDNENASVTAAIELYADGRIQVTEAEALAEGSARYMDAVVNLDSTASHIDVQQLSAVATGHVSLDMRSRIGLNSRTENSTHARMGNRDLHIGQLIADADNQHSDGTSRARINAYGHHINLLDGARAESQQDPLSSDLNLRATGELTVSGTLEASSMMLAGHRVHLQNVDINVGALGVGIVAGTNPDAFESLDGLGVIEGADILLDGAHISGPLAALAAAGAIHDAGDNVIASNYLILAAGQRIDLASTELRLASERGLEMLLTSSPLLGDLAAFDALAQHLLPLPELPIMQGLFRAPQIRLAVDGLAGDYLRFQADQLTLTGSAPAIDNLLVQITPWSDVEAFALEAGTHSEHAVTYSIDMLRAAFPGTTYLFGTSGYAGSIHIGGQGPIHTQGAPNFAFIAGTVYGSHLLHSDGLQLALGDTQIEPPPSADDPAHALIEETAAQIRDIEAGDPAGHQDIDRKDSITLADGGTPGETPDIEHEHDAPQAGDCQ